MAGETLEQIAVSSEAELLAWLDANHGQGRSVWLVLWRKSANAGHIERERLLAALLRYGWVDSLPRKKDAGRSLLMISPRKPGSAWSAVNKRIVLSLERQGLMHPAGQAIVDAAREDGSWSFLDDVEQGIVPDDLAAALDAVPGARGHFDAFPFSARRGILEWIKQARRPGTRAKRIAETARLAGRNRRARDWRAGKPRGG
ncbi:MULTISPECIES: YdeI/OmpD-associated family protein [unclassified Roseitalea]|uniref:YdeI/OmpD-associated family protein n=1 Tax=unclassified Roseitalea TaxID=2639107 RepID=UPI00273E59F8|nr:MULTISPECIES: YdeI/OmpD-associated family protein [unclassified Roseitalea]